MIQHVNLMDHTILNGIKLVPCIFTLAQVQRRWLTLDKNIVKSSPLARAQQNTGITRKISILARGVVSSLF